MKNTSFVDFNTAALIIVRNLNINSVMNGESG